MFVDEVEIEVAGGDGGDGCLSFRREKFVPRGGPDGGDGGEGGSVILLADSSVSTLLEFRYQRRHTAARGRHGQGSNKTGRSGRNLTLRVPKGTVALDRDSGHLAADLSSDGQSAVVARGGRGGRGNARFATAGNRAPTRHEPGEQGESRRLRLELKLMADVGLVGLPNAGKSTLISRLSAARPKIAEYPFTTLEPHLGVVDRGGYRSFVVADIPGLIEGAHSGAGLGLRFLRHVERCRLLLHLVDAAGGENDPLAAVDTVERELAAYGHGLIDKPRVLAATKIDALQDRTVLDRLRARAERLGGGLLAISAVRGDGLEALVRTVGELLDGLPAPVAPGRERASDDRE
jgi:GTP-binding protein